MKSIPYKKNSRERARKSECSLDFLEIYTIDLNFVFLFEIFTKYYEGRASKQYRNWSQMKVAGLATLTLFLSLSLSLSLFLYL